MSNASYISLLELNQRVQSTLASTPGLFNVWVTGETSDLRCSGPHCYLELIDKDERGTPVARARATIWGSCWNAISRNFRAATGASLTSGIKVMVKASVTFHPVYGLSLNITDVNPEYTLGDLMRRRQEMIKRLTAEGIINLNRELPWPRLVQRIAVVSAPGAAGYGDFINQLYTNRHNLKFATRLFPAVLQGENTAPSIIRALEAIATGNELFDCVVIIRGGGATGDLASFDNYELAANIAMFPLPVIIGIGHERDITLLDYVANMRVKTPTAAAEWLIGRGTEQLDRLSSLASAILEAASGTLNTAHRRLENISGQLPALALGVVALHRQKTGPDALAMLAQGVQNLLTRSKDRLTTLGEQIDTLSPEATLRRGFSITTFGGKALSDPSTLSPGDTITTILAKGNITSTVE